MSSPRTFSPTSSTTTTSTAKTTSQSSSTGSKATSSGAIKQETLRALNPFYAAIRNNAAADQKPLEKQGFLKAIYEDFYKAYNPKAADRLGVVYTPTRSSASWCRAPTGSARSISAGPCRSRRGDPRSRDRHRHLLFELIEHFRGEPTKLRHKYKEELHANEVAILPYYVANLNIEATYPPSPASRRVREPVLRGHPRQHRRASDKSGYQVDMFGALTDENVKRGREQNERKISVIIGNPPYNANQQNENDNNKNRAYPHIDGLSSRARPAPTAQKTKVYDMYARFFRWASDRLHDDGVIACVTNRSFIDSRTYDGFRRYAARALQ